MAIDYTDGESVLAELGKQYFFVAVMLLFNADHSSNVNIFRDAPISMSMQYRLILCLFVYDISLYQNAVNFHSILNASRYIYIRTY